MLSCCKGFIEITPAVVSLSHARVATAADLPLLLKKEKEILRSIFIFIQSNAIRRADGRFDCLLWPVISLDIVKKTI